jgi:hypothetical protein
MLASKSDVLIGSISCLLELYALSRNNTLIRILCLNALRVLPQVTIQKNRISH